MATNFDDVRSLALSMAEVEEASAYGMSAFKAGKTRFAGQPVPRAGIEPDTIGVRVGFEGRARLLATRPEVYYLIDHFANYPAVLVRLRRINREELADILAMAWQSAMENQRPARKQRLKASVPKPASSTRRPSAKPRRR